jgi:hypothetical protein
VVSTAVEKTVGGGHFGRDDCGVVATAVEKTVG